jgi:hypothetical protein
MGIRKLGLRKHLFFMEGSHQKGLKLIGLCMSIGLSLIKIILVIIIPIMQVQKLLLCLLIILQTITRRIL